VVGGVVRMRVNDMQKILREEEEAAAAAAATSVSSERVLKDEE
jgi:gephyrin